MIAENFLNIRRGMAIQVKEASRSPNTFNPKINHQEAIYSHVPHNKEFGQ